MSLLLRLVLAVGLTWCIAQSARADDAPLAIKGAITIGADDVIALVQTSPNLTIVDNRAVADYEAGHIEAPCTWSTATSPVKRCSPAS